MHLLHDMQWVAKPTYTAHLQPPSTQNYWCPLLMHVLAVIDAILARKKDCEQLFSRLCCTFKKTTVIFNCSTTLQISISQLCPAIISYHFAIACMKLIRHMHARKYLTHLYMATPVLTPSPVTTNNFLWPKFVTVLIGFNYVHTSSVMLDEIQVTRM
jgi:hypothetical protein